VEVKLLTRKVVQSLQKDGLWATLRKCLGYLRDDGATANEFDLKYGTDTGGIAPLWRFKISSPNVRFGRRYQATQENDLVDALDFLREDFKAFTFIDLGCGKGRTLLVASNLGFRQVIGVEFVSELVEIARTNLARRRIANAVVLHADAAEFRFPNSDTVVYLYNPFEEEVLRKVIANLRECLSNQKVYVIYKNQEFAEVLDSSGFLSRFGCPPAARNTQIWSVAK
jgi:SAM-dependent methyltransferase